MGCRMIRLKYLVGIICMLFGMHAVATTYDFESFADSQAVVQLTGGITLSHGVALAAGVSLNELEAPPHSGRIVVVDDGAPITIDFGTNAALSFAAYFTYFSPLKLEAFDTNGALLGSVHSSFASNAALSGDAGSSANQVLGFAVSSGAIQRVVLTGDPLGYSFAMDDMSVTHAVSVTPIPEPATWALHAALICVMSGLGLFRGRKPG
jgi:hypothetical protein